MTIFYSSTVGEKTNCVYPKHILVTDESTMAEAAAFDHVAVAYKDNYRSQKNFLKADCVPMDCDNDHSDNPDDWVTPFDVSLAFQGVEMIAVYSRNDMKLKESKSPRPRFHVYFACNEIIDPSVYTKLKRRIAEEFPYFDKNALDAGRFLFGVPNPKVEVYKGNRKIDDILGNTIPTKTVNTQSAIITPRQENSSPLPVKKGPSKREKPSIPEGCRNNTMSQYAGKLIKRLGNTQDAYQQFLKEAEKCNPPLPDTELQQIWKSAVNFGTKISAQAGYIPPNQYQPNKAKTLCPEDFTDIGQAKVLSNEYSQQLRYSPSTDYMVYNGSIWEESKIKAQGLAQELTDRQLKEAETEIEYWDNEMEANGAKELLRKLGKDALGKFDDKQMLSYTSYNDANEYKAFALRRRSTNCVTASLKEVCPMVQIEPNSLDANELLLNTPSATYDLHTGLPRSHSFSDYITKQTAVDPSPNGMDIWKDALDTFFQRDAELIDYVQEIAGLASIGKVYNEGLIIAYGEGRNGKSTFWNTISRVLGTYAGSLSAENLTISNRNNNKFEIAEARGKRLIIASELEEGMRLNTAKVKQLCSTDPISAEKKYKDPFSYFPTHTLVLYTNHLPRVGARDKGTWRRLVVIPFTANIEGKADKKNYADYLFSTAGGAVLSWILEGAKRAIGKNYLIEPPKSVRDAIQQYKDDNDWLQHFLDDCCEIKQDVEEKSGELYSSYRNYCNQMGEYTRSTTDFYAALDSAGYTRYKHKSGKMVRGLHLKSDF